MSPYDHLYIGEREIIPTAQAAQQVVCSREYISMLCRAGKLEAARLPAGWYVFIDSLEQFITEREQHKEDNRQATRQLRLQEIARGEILNRSSPVHNSFGSSVRPATLQ